MSFKKFKALLDLKKSRESKTHPKRPVRPSATFKRFMAESSYAQKKI